VLLASNGNLLLLPTLVCVGAYNKENVFTPFIRYFTYNYLLLLCTDDKITLIFHI